ncbi:MAG: hypothetical protein BWY99_02510 [Synergistetes bacterium ADurb.BinA166]|nr:MAG: hypothetical protein BWY99_02510 [Synergistetes bacterium ADurb.BinA166]
MTKDGTDVTSSLVLTATGTWRLALSSVSGNRAIVASFKSSPGGGTPETRYIVEATAYPADMGTIEITVGGVSHGATSYDRLSLTAGAVVTITVTPFDGCKAIYRNVNGTYTDLPEGGETYSIASLAGNITYEARFGERR